MGSRFGVDPDLKWLLTARRGSSRAESHNTLTQEHIILCRMINKRQACKLLTGRTPVTVAQHGHATNVPPAMVRNKIRITVITEVVLHLSHSVTVMGAGILVVTQREDRARQLYMCLGGLT